jgi:hypothetical protein
MGTRTKQVVAFWVLFAFLSCVLSSYPGLQKICIALSAILLVVVIAMRIHEIRNRDPYSLNELNDMVRERYNDDTSEAEMVDHDGDLFCMCCQETYNAKFVSCPKCATKQLRK